MAVTVTLFFVFAGILIAAAMCVITVRNPVYAALFLVLAFFSGAALWLLQEAEFLAITLVLVYVGAVMVLFLFVVMMLDINLDRLREGFWKYLPVGAPVGIVMALEMALVVGSKNFGGAGSGGATGASVAYSNTRALGQVLYTTYLYPFEIAAVILLVAIVAAIALTMRRRKDTKYQAPAQQVQVRRADRIRLVTMPSSERQGRKLREPAATKERA
jgi:NADH-quinone oxidoreductase subunit J